MNTNQGKAGGIFKSKELGIPTETVNGPWNPPSLVVPAAWALEDVLHDGLCDVHW